MIAFKERLKNAIKELMYGEISSSRDYYKQRRDFYLTETSIYRAKNDHLQQKIKQLETKLSSKN